MVQRYRYPYYPFPQLDLSGGQQSATSHLLRKGNEVFSTKNAAYNIKIGSAVRRPGYEKVGQTIEQGNDSLYGGIFNYFNNNKIIVGINDTANTNATLRYYDQNGYFTNIITDAPVNCRFQCLNYLNEFYVAGCSPTNQYVTLQNIDSTLVASSTRNVQFAPQAKYIAEYQGALYAINCKVNGTVHKDRAYISSNPLAITFLSRINGAQSGLLQQLQLDIGGTQYIKPGMVLDIYGAAGGPLNTANLTIVDVDKKNDKISFAPTNLTVADNDELYLAGRRNEISIYWNVDNPTAQEADFIQAPSDKEADPEFTGWGKNSNLLFLFTKNSTMKWDGSNLIAVSDTIGCVSHESIQNIGSWIIWLHTTGVWGYNDNTGQLKLLSRSIQDTIRAINQSNLSKASAIVVGRVYKLAVGTLLDLTTDTTSTSTSSTSTSSTSSSTSSTSTSSTSTSSTSTSQTNTTTSTSSTSGSTSSTSQSSTSTSVSTSTSSTSLSTSTSSTSTSTAVSTKKITRLVYDFDSNIWWLEEHKREIRFQFNHTMHGYTKPYFTDDTGRLFRDETGQLDNADSIAMEIIWGRINLGTDLKKNFMSAMIDSEAARGAIVQYSIDGGPYNTLGEIFAPVSVLNFPQSSGQVRGRDINYKIVHNSPGSQAIFNGITTYYSYEEFLPNELS